MKRANKTGVAWGMIAVASTVAIAALVAIRIAHPADWASAVSGLLGTVIGFVGAAASAFLLFERQTQDEADRIYEAVVREVAEFSRFTVGNLSTCREMRGGNIAILRDGLPRIMGVPAPTVYPAVADRIGLLHAPQPVVAFYNRIVEAGRMVEIVAMKYQWLVSTRTSGIAPRIDPAELEELADIWASVCQLAAQILNQESALVEDEVIAILKRRIVEELEQTKNVFPSLAAFNPEASEQ